jgi:hypothetical protein
MRVFASAGHNDFYRESESDREIDILLWKGTAKRVQQHDASGGQRAAPFGIPLSLRESRFEPLSFNILIARDQIKFYSIILSKILPLYESSVAAKGQIADRYLKEQNWSHR